LLFSALIGLAISTVYKLQVCGCCGQDLRNGYSDRQPGDTELYGFQQPSVVAWMGVLVVVTATAMYGRITSLIPRESVSASSPCADRDAGGEEGGGGKDGGQEVEMLLPAAGFSVACCAAGFSVAAARGGGYDVDIESGGEERQSRGAQSPSQLPASSN
jgi:hypothetical protein